MPCVAAFLASMLTFLSGFGLGTILLPVFALMVPIQDAILLTAIVHMLNNVFKLFLIGKQVMFDLAMKFALFAIPASFLGSYLLDEMGEAEVLHQYMMNGEIHTISAVNLIVGLLMLVFAAFEIVPKLKSLQFPLKWLPIGGLLSGFFGGMSGHQGALRSAFLVRAGLSKEAFIATGVLIAVAIDATRIPYYLYSLNRSTQTGNSLLWLLPALCGFAGAFMGNKLLRKVTFASLQIIVAILLSVIALLLMAGII